MTVKLYTADHKEIVPGLLAFDNNLDLVIVPPFEREPHVDHGQPATSAWFDVIRVERGGETLMNGERLSTGLYYTSDKRNAREYALSKHCAVVVTGPRFCDVCKFTGDHKQDVPAVGDFKTISGPWADICWDHLLTTSAQLGKAGTGYGQYFLWEN